MIYLCTGFIPYTYGKKEIKANADGDTPQNIDADSFKCIHQSTARFAMGNKSSKDHALTCTAYVNGVSSSVPIILSSRVHHIEWDIVLATPSHLKRYKLYDNDPNLNSRRYMDGFSIVMGCTSKEGRKARSEEFDNAMEMEEEEEKNADEDSEEEDDFECDWGDGIGGGLKKKTLQMSLGRSWILGAIQEYYMIKMFYRLRGYNYVKCGGFAGPSALLLLRPTL